MALYEFCTALPWSVKAASVSNKLSRTVQFVLPARKCRLTYRKRLFRKCAAIPAPEVPKPNSTPPRSHNVFVSPHISVPVPEVSTTSDGLYIRLSFQSKLEKPSPIKTKYTSAAHC